MSKIKIRTVVVPNVIVSACKLRSTYNGNYGLQYGAHLTGAGLSEVGLKEAQDGGHWYSTNAKYGNTDVMVDPVSIQDMEGNDIEADLENGSTAHILFELRDYPAGVRKDGTKFVAGTNARIVAVRAVAFNIKTTYQDKLSMHLLEMHVSEDSSPMAKTADGDCPF